MIAEDRDDVTIYEAVAEGYVFNSRDVKALRVALQTYGGGGQNTADALRDHARQGLTLCLADSDRKWPGGPEGETARDLKRAQKKLERDYVIDVHVLLSHELENIVPARLVTDSFKPSDGNDFREPCLAAETLGFLGAPAPLHHLDLKQGLCFQDVRDAAAPAAKLAFLAEVFDAHRARVPRPAGGWCEAEVKCVDRDTCQCILFKGLGDKVIKHVAEHVLAGLSPQKSAEYFFASRLPCASVWIEIGRLIFSWGCAYKRSRA